MFVFISQRFYKNWKLFLPTFIEKNTSKEQLIFSEYWLTFFLFQVFETENESFGPYKTTLYFWLNFRKMASDNIKGEKRGDIWQWQKNLKPQYHSILPLIQYSFTTFELQAK